MNDSKRVASEMETVAVWVAELPSWGDLPVTVGGSPGDWAVICWEHSPAAVAWLAGIACRSPHPCSTGIVAGGPIGHPADTVAQNRWRLYTDGGYHLTVSITVPVTGAHEYAEAMAVARGEKLTRPVRTRSPKTADPAPTGELEGQAELFPEFAGATHE